MDLKQFDGHTPGPWAVHGNDVVADDGSVVADVAGGYWWRGKRPPFAANARLMAASPELLDEVRRLTAEAADLRRERDELAARLEAIERAEPVAWMHADRRMASGWAPRSARAENFVGWSPLICIPGVARQPPAAEPVQVEPVGGCSDSVSCPRGER